MRGKREGNEGGCSGDQSLFSSDRPMTSARALREDRGRLELANTPPSPFPEGAVDERGRVRERAMRDRASRGICPHNLTRLEEEREQDRGGGRERLSLRNRHTSYLCKHQSRANKSIMAENSS